MAALNPSTGEIVIRKFLTDRNDLARKLADLPRPLMVAVESSRHSPAICRWLQAMGAQVRLVNAAKLAKHTEGKAAKTDANDAEAMLRLMRLDELPECYLASEELGPLSACMARVFWALLGELEAHLALVNSEVKSQVAAHPVARQLCTLPEIGCIERFADPKNLHSYAGVVPRVSQSGDSRRTGSLVRECNRHLRRAATSPATAVQS